jgi:hypothetical protein
MWPCIVDIVKVKNRLDATKYAVLLPQHVSGTNMPIIRSTISEYLPLLGSHTWNAAWVVHYTVLYRFIQATCFDPLKRSSSGHPNHTYTDGNDRITRPINQNKSNHRKIHTGQPKRTSSLPTHKTPKCDSTAYCTPNNILRAQVLLELSTQQAKLIYARTSINNHSIILKITTTR